MELVPYSDKYAKRLPIALSALFRLEELGDTPGIEILAPILVPAVEIIAIPTSYIWMFLEKLE